MDSNYMLKLLRDAITELEHSHITGPAYETAMDVVDKFSILDNELKGNGRLPESWNNGVRFEDIDKNDKCFIVFPGVPSTWFINNNGGDMMDEARDEAASKAEYCDKPFTYMLIPKASLELAITMVPMGIVAKSTTSVIAEGIH